MITLFVTGEGRTTPAGVDGFLPAVNAWPQPVGAVQVKFGDKIATPEFYGLVYAGEMQINVRIPADAPSGSNVPITVLVGGVSTQDTATIAIR